MALFILIALLCLGLAAHPFASRRLPPLVQGTLGGMCVVVSFALLALMANGQTWAQEKPLVELEVETPTPAPAEQADHRDTSKNVKHADTDSPAAEVESLTPEVDTVIIPPGRPSWVEAAPVREGAVHYTSVCSDPYATPSQAQHALDEKLQAAVAEYIQEYLESDLAPKLIQFRLAEIKRDLLRTGDVYAEKIQVSIGSMHQVHARLEFDDAFRAKLDKRWGELRATYRLAETGVVSGGVLLLLATVFGYFRLDNATRGYYTGRLQFMAAAAILTIVAGGAMFSRWIHWL